MYPLKVHSSYRTAGKAQCKQLELSNSLSEFYCDSILFNDKASKLSLTEDKVLSAGLQVKVPH
jgi:hypothetical protein